MKLHPRDHTASQADSIRGLTRRKFIQRTAGATAGLAFGSKLSASAKSVRQLPNPNKSGIEHIVLLMMENRSFDHFLGWLPGAEGRQANLSYKDLAGSTFSTHPLAPDFQGCGFADPDHSYEGGRAAYDGGLCDGWLRAGSNDTYCIGYYTQPDLAFLGNAAPYWTTCDNYFAAILAGTYPNRIYQHAAQTDRLDDSLLPFSTLPTIWDRLADHNISRRYYFSDLPLIALWGTKYLSISAPIGEFFSAAAAGTLPEVSFVEPRFLGEGQGLSVDDHPFSDIRNGEAFINSVYEAVVRSPNWAQTVLIITFDGWGRFFDHVAPSVAPIPPADAALGSDGLRGFRVPTLVISPWSPRGTVVHGLYDHTSVLKLMEWRWHLDPLTVRDSTARNLAEVLDFSQPNPDAPTFVVPAGSFGGSCPGSLPNPDELALLAFLAQLGFQVPL